MAHVLVVENDKTSARHFELVLTRMGGLDVTVTDDAEEVMEIAQSGGADLILMNVSLPDSVYEGEPVNGLDLTSLLKEDPFTCDVPVVLTTAQAMKGDREAFLDSTGADEYIPMPIEDNMELVNLVVRLLDAQSERAA